MRIASREEMRRIDTETSRRRGISAELLMEVAGARAASEIETLLTAKRFHFSKPKPKPKPRGSNEDRALDAARVSFVVVCGVGHNGADGLVVARHLRANGHDVFVHLIGDQARSSDLFRSQLKRVRNFGVETRKGLHTEDLRRLPEVIVIDAIFGIGLNREVQGEELSSIEIIRQSKVTVVSLDTPSGLDVDRGIVLGQSIKADFTLSFGLAKCGFFIQDGPRLVGVLIIVPIGFPPDLVKEVARGHSLFDRKAAVRNLPRVESTTNKAKRGRALLVAGSKGMWGAAILSATSAARAGAGYVVLASSDDARETLASLPEVLHAEPSRELWKDPKWTSLAIGPGLGLTPAAREIVKALVSIRDRAVVADADAITILSEMNGVELGTNWILTPHAGELSRLLRVKAREIESDRIKYALMAAQKFRAIVLLKGFRTVIAHPGDDLGKGGGVVNVSGDGDGSALSGKVWIVASGNSALAKAGSGDVLTGMILGFLAQGMKPVRAAAVASYVHGLAADRWVSSGNGRASLLPTDVRDALPEILGDLARPSSRRSRIRGEW